MAKQKTCGACGEAFECAAPSHGCWCESMKLSPEALALLRDRFADCLCPKCLPKIAAEDKVS